MSRFWVGFRINTFRNAFFQRIQTGWRRFTVVIPPFRCFSFTGAIVQGELVNGVFFQILSFNCALEGFCVEAEGGTTFELS